MENEYIDPLAKKKTWFCERHKVTIAGENIECPLCKIERKHPFFDGTLDRRRHWKWKKSNQAPLNPAMIHLIDQSVEAGCGQIA